MIYNRTVYGPEPELPFVVLSGYAAVVGEQCSVALPPGTVWPGSRVLPPELLEWLRPVETYLVRGSEWAAWTPTPRDIEVATTLVQVQQLRQVGPLVGRLEALGRTVNLDAQSQNVLAAILGTSREGLSKALRTVRQANAAD